jgi:mRNA-degrading endonuclease toxin of MazEF toxin-antitoxin module
VPEPGLVISYAYLWRREQQQGHEEGRKVRPAVIILAVRAEPSGAPRVTVAPITHSPPSDPDLAVELPGRVKTHLGLDDQRSWIVIDEVTSSPGRASTCGPCRARRMSSPTGSYRPGCSAR